MTRLIQILGQSDYEQIHQLQKVVVEARASRVIDDTILLLEHSSVLTVGRKTGATANLLDSNAPTVYVERGGDVTWHGPGQLVAYPIVALTGGRADLRLHLRSLEDAVIGLISDLGLAPHRDDRNTGVWMGDASDRHKVCSIGIACRRWVTWHGLALNVCPDMANFGRINPCGFDSSIMTSLQQHLAPTPSVQALAAPLATHLCQTLAIKQGHIEYADHPWEVASILNIETKNE